MKMIKKIAQVAALMIILLTIGAAFYAVLRLPQLPDDLNRIALATPTKIFAEDGKMIKLLANRQIVPFDQISSTIIKAVLALEDRYFYTHHGISKNSLIRAFLVNLRHGEVKQGGSTITQQLAKNLFFSFERSYIRKIQEVFITLQIEQQFSKQEILEAYLNQIDFGSGIYGVELAAQTYFSKHADELTNGEAAMLAGIPRWPARYNPYKYPEIAKQRQTFVLKKMLEQKYITDQEYKVALNERLAYNSIFNLHGHADYFIDAVIDVAADSFGRNAVMYGGLEIFTTLNSNFQLAASLAIQQGLAELDETLGLQPIEQVPWAQRKNYPQAALVAVDPKTGAVKAMVGGRDFRSAPFNRALANNRQAGSAFKPFIYTAAIDKGIVDPTTVMIDEPTQFRIYNQIWAPENYDLEFMGPMTIKMALAESRNVIAAKVIEKVGASVVIEYAHAMGISSTLEPHLSLALGTAGVSPLEMAAGYSTLASEGIYRQPFLIRKINSPQKNILENEFKSKRVFDQQTCFIMIDMLSGVVDFGTGKTVRTRGFYRPCAGKTGTTNDYRDAWFVGFTPELVTAVWVGFDDNHPMRNTWGSGVTGATGGLPIWTIFMSRALKDK
ncbi:MAG: PBP1A family penicillin-binding protein, partial [Calditrichaeota bacterium]